MIYNIMKYIHTGISCDERMAAHGCVSGCIGLYIPSDLEISLGPRDVQPLQYLYILEYIQKKKQRRVRASIVSSFLQYPTIFVQNILGPQFANILRDEHCPMENSKIMIPKQPKNL